MPAILPISAHSTERSQHTYETATSAISDWNKQVDHARAIQNAVDQSPDGHALQMQGSEIDDRHGNVEGQDARLINVNQEVIIGGPYTDERGTHRYGHAALRVHGTDASGNTYDTTYDFGRYRGARGTFGETGEGILQKWNNFSVYIGDQNAKGRTSTGYEYRTTPEQDLSTTKYFDDLQGKGKIINSEGAPKPDATYNLEKGYDATNNNCTTMSIDGVRAAKPELADKLTDPSESKGRSLNWVERRAASGSVGSKIFMPEDLRANIEKDRSYIKKHEYSTPEQKHK